MNNVLRYLTKICEFEVLGIDPRASAEKLKNIYLIKDYEFDKYVRLMMNSTYLNLKTLNQVQIHKNLIDAYSINVFGKRDKDEKLLLDAKLDAFKRISKICGDEPTIEVFSQNISLSYVKSIIGMACVFGLLDVGDANYGVNLINMASNENDVDAKLYQLMVFPEKAKEILTTIANTKEYVYKFSDLKVWLKHHNVEDIKIKEMSVKIGFGV